MKRISLLLVYLVAILPALFADNDKPITIDQLPASSKQFIKTYFSDLKVSYAKMESELFGKSYEVIFVDGSKAEFNGKGEWTDVDCKFSQVPTEIIPQKIWDYISSNYKDVKVKGIDRGSHDYEVKLSNSLELKFDLKFNLIDIDN